jgi:hypothetical protein
MDETGFVTVTLTKEESNFRRSCLHTEVPAFRHAGVGGEPAMTIIWILGFAEQDDDI